MDNEQIIAMIKEQLFLGSSSAAVKIIGLFLLSDILHNSGAPIKQASNYRLDLIFTSLNISFDQDCSLSSEH